MVGHWQFAILTYIRLAVKRVHMCEERTHLMRFLSSPDLIVSRYLWCWQVSEGNRSLNIGSVAFCVLYPPTSGFSRLVGNGTHAENSVSDGCCVPYYLHRRPVRSPQPNRHAKILRTSCKNSVSCKLPAISSLITPIFELFVLHFFNLPNPSGRTRTWGLLSL
jgi:hypothetical protein